MNGGSVDPRLVARINAALAGAPIEPIDDGVPALTHDELAFFDEHGYVVLREAVEAQAARAAEDAIWTHLQMDRDDPETWYSGAHGYSIWVPLIHHPALDANARRPASPPPSRSCGNGTTSGRRSTKAASIRPSGPTGRFPGRICTGT